MSFAVFGKNKVKAEKDTNEFIRHLEMDNSRLDNYIAEHPETELATHLTSHRNGLQGAEQYQKASDEVFSEIMADIKPTKISVFYDGLGACKDYLALIRKEDPKAFIKQKILKVNKNDEPILSKKNNKQYEWRML